MFLRSHRDTEYSCLPWQGRHTEESLHALLAPQPVEHLGPGQALFIEGDEAKHIFDVAEGALRIFKTLHDGHRTVTGFLLEGDVFGVSLNDHYVYSVEAITNAKVRRVSRAALSRAMARSEELRQEVLAHTADKVAAAQEHMVLLSCKSAEERVCSFLLRYMRRTASGAAKEPLLYFPMTRLDLGDYLGLSLETVSRIFAKLQGEKIVTQSGRHFLRVNQPEAISRRAGHEQHRDAWLESSAPSEDRHLRY